MTLAKKPATPRRRKPKVAALGTTACRALARRLCAGVSRVALTGRLPPVGPLADPFLAPSRHGR